MALTSKVWTANPRYVGKVRAFKRPVRASVDESIRFVHPPIPPRTIYLPADKLRLARGSYTEEPKRKDERMVQWGGSTCRAGSRSTMASYLTGKWRDKSKATATPSVVVVSEDII